MRCAARIAVTCLLVTLAYAAPLRVQATSGSYQPGGVVLDGYGGLHPFGGAVVNTGGAPYWPGWDIARGVIVRQDGDGGWTLDGFGGIHAWGSAATIPTPAYWPGWDIARDLVLTSTDASGEVDGRQGYMLDGFGGIHPWGGAPVLSGAPYPMHDVARGLAVHMSSSGAPDGGWMLYKDGSIHAFGAAPALPVSLPNDDVFQKLRPSTASAGYAVAKWGMVTTWGGVSPYWTGYSDWGAWDIVRDVFLLRADNPSPTPEPSSTAASSLYNATLQPHGGVVLDGFGGLHPLAGFTVDTAGAPYWANWDIARSVVLREDGSGGWTLDGFGGIHAWGSAPPIQTPGYWASWDIARAIAVTSHTAAGISDGAQGYLLDGFGGLHPWGGAPDIGAPPYTAGFDIYRGLAIHFTSAGVPDGGWAMDEFGRIYPFGNAHSFGHVLVGSMRPIFHALHTTPLGAYTVQHDGLVAPISGIVRPYWAAWSDWGAWDIVRDIALINPANPDSDAQPLSAAAQAGYNDSVWGTYRINAPLVRQQHPLDCEAASMQMALAARGTSVTQDWELAFWGADLRAAVRDSAGNILRWGDPFQTFVGNVNASEWNATGYGIYYPPLVNLAHATGHAAIGKQNWNVSELYALVAAGYPAAIEISYDMQPAAPRVWTAWDGQAVPYILNDHVVTLVGVDFGAQTIIVNDPYTGTVKYFSFASFERAFSYLGNMATVIS